MRYFPQKMDPEAALADLQSLDPRVRTAAADALGSPGDDPRLRERAVKALLGLVRRDQDPEVRYTAALSLGDLGDRRAVRPLVERVAGEGHPMPRQAIIIALGLLGDVRAADPLTRMLAHDSPDVRFQAATSLVQVAGRQAARPLTGVLQDDDAEVRAAAAAGLGDAGDPAYADAVAGLLSDPAHAVRMEAAAALARLGDRRGTPTLVQQLGDSRWQVLAGEMLYRCPDPEAREPMRARLGRWLTPPLLKVLLAGALVRLRDVEPGHEALLRALASSRQEVRGLAIEVLGELGTLWAREALLALLQSPDGDSWRVEIEEALAEDLEDEPQPASGVNHERT